MYMKSVCEYILTKGKTWGWGKWKRSQLHFLLEWLREVILIEFKVFSWKYKDPGFSTEPSRCAVHKNWPLYFTGWALNFVEYYKLRSLYFSHALSSSQIHLKDSNAILHIYVLVNVYINLLFSFQLIQSFAQVFHCYFKKSFFRL